MNKKVLIINLGWEQQPLIDRLFSRGYIVYGVHNNDKYEKRPYEKVLISDFRDLEKILNFAQSISIDAVISDQCDYSHFAQAFLCEKLNLKGPDIENAQISSNKFLQRTLAKKKGVLVPDFELVFNIQEAKHAARKLNYPVIVKPIDNRGSFGVSKVNNEVELHDAYYNALINSHSRFVLIEQFINGYEVTVDGYCFNGKPKSLAIALKSKEGLTSQVSMDIKYPADIPIEIIKKALVNNEKVGDALGYNIGMVHSEYMIDHAGNIYLIESANRGGGVFTSEIIVPAVSGINLLDIYIDDCCELTHKEDIAREVQSNEVILKFFAFKSGKIRSVEGVEKVSLMPGVLKCRINVEPGDTIKAIENDGGRHGFIIYTSKGNVREEVKQIINQIKVSYE